MTKYELMYDITTTYRVVVEAENEQEALIEADRMYDNDEIIGKCEAIDEWNPGYDFIRKID